MAARRPPHVPTRMPKLDATGIVRHPLEQSDRPPAQIYLPNSTVHRALSFRLSSRPPCPVRPPAPGLPSALHPGQGPASLLLTPRAIPRLPSPWPCPKARSLRSLRKKDLEDHHASPHSPSQRTGAIQRAIDFREDEQPAFSILKTTRKRKVACVDVVYPASLQRTIIFDRNFYSPNLPLSFSLYRDLLLALQLTVSSAAPLNTPTPRSSPPPCTLPGLARPAPASMQGLLRAREFAGFGRHLVRRRDHRGRRSPAAHRPASAPG